MNLVGSLRRRREVAILVVVLAAAAIAILAYATHLMRSLELQSVDARFSARGAQAQPSDIVVVYPQRRGDWTQDGLPVAISGTLELGAKVDAKTGFVSLVRVVDADVATLR